jgi:hypothetical protein
VAACVWLLARAWADRLIVAELAIGSGAVWAILWEYAQHAIGRTIGYLETAYADTLSDLACRLLGSTSTVLVLLISAIAARRLAFEQQLGRTEPGQRAVGPYPCNDG